MASTHNTKSKVQNEVLAALLEGYRDEVVAAWVRSTLFDGGLCITENAR